MLVAANSFTRIPRSRGAECFCRRANRSARLGASHVQSSPLRRFDCFDFRGANKHRGWPDLGPEILQTFRSPDRGIRNGHRTAKSGY
jgi:hypothetical protein